MRKRGWWSLLSVLVVLPLLLAAGSCDLTDTDGDGVPDSIDMCPLDPGKWENAGCPVIPDAEYDCDNPPALAGFVPVKNPVPDRVIVVMKPLTGRLAVTAASVQALAAKYGVTNVQPFSRGFSGTIKATVQLKAGQKVPSAVANGVKALTSLLRDPSVRYVAQVGRLSAPPIFQGVKSSAALSWALDRIDARKGLDGVFAPTGKGKDVAFIVDDTGGTETSETRGRVSPQCFSTIVFRGCEDGHGHGTFCSVEGCGTTLGVLPEATIYRLRFLDDNGSGTSDDAIRTLEKAIEWKLAEPERLFVLNASWGGSPDPPVDDAACRVIAAGIPFVAAAGNESADAYTSSPARVKQAITVMATDRNDKIASFSNYGPGVDVGAPGVDVLGMLPGGSVEAWNGTSMAAPLVTAAAGLCLAAHPDATVAEVHDCIVSNSTKDALSELPTGTANRLLFVGREGGGEGTPGKAQP